MTQHTVAKYFDANYVLGLGVEFAGFVDKQGRVIDYACKNEINLSKEQKEMFFMMIALNTSMQRDYDDDLGAVKYTVTDRENSKIICIPIPTGVIVLMTNRAADHHQIVKRTLESIDNAKSLDGDISMVLSQLLRPNAFIFSNIVSFFENGSAASSASSDKDEYLKKGDVRAVLKKPIDPDELLNYLQQFDAKSAKGLKLKHEFI